MGNVVMVAGTAPALPFVDHGVAAVTLLGGVSLIDDLEPAVDKATRVVSRNGLIEVTNLCLGHGDHVLRAGPNVFRSPAAMMVP